MSLFSCAIAEAGIVSISGILHMVVNLFAVVVDSDSRCPHAVEHADKWIPRLSNHNICSAAVGDLSSDVFIQKFSFVRCPYLCWVTENGVRPCVALSSHHKATDVPMAPCHDHGEGQFERSVRSIH
jgi:hypothetical protein